MAPPPRGGVGAGVRPELVPLDGVAAPLRREEEPPDRLAVERLAGAALRAAGALAWAVAGAWAFDAAAALATGTAVATTEMATGSDGDGAVAGRALGVGTTVGTASASAAVAGAEALADGDPAEERVCCTTSPAPPTWALAGLSWAEERREAAGREEEREERLAMTERGSGAGAEVARGLCRTQIRP